MKHSTRDQPHAKRMQGVAVNPALSSEKRQCATRGGKWESDEVILPFTLLHIAHGIKVAVRTWNNQDAEQPHCFVSLAATGHSKFLAQTGAIVDDCGNVIGADGASGGVAIKAKRFAILG